VQLTVHVRGPTAALLARVPVQFYAFDLVHLGNHSTLNRPYTERRQLLAGLHLDDEVVKTPPWWSGDAGTDLMDAAAEQGLEGVIAKRIDSPYQSGIRSRYCIEAPLSATTEVIIVGWKPGGGRRAGMIGYK
jgi:bifunctional non-homologous end joining protein LigD